MVASALPSIRICAPLTKPLPFAVIVNAPDETEVGEMLTRAGTGFQSVTGLLAFDEFAARLTAVIVMVLEAGTICGAIYLPDALIVPVAELPPVTPFTCQWTSMFEVPETVALKDWVAPARRFALEGDTVTVTPAPESGVFDPDPDEVVVPVQPARTAAQRRNAAHNECGTANLMEFFI